MIRQISPSPEDLVQQGFAVVADPNTRLYHTVIGPCYKREKQYVPLGSEQEAQAHDYQRCNKCCASQAGSDSFGTGSSREG